MLGFVVVFASNKTVFRQRWSMAWSSVRYKWTVRGRKEDRAETEKVEEIRVPTFWSFLPFPIEIETLCSAFILKHAHHGPARAPTHTHRYASALTHTYSWIWSEGIYDINTHSIIISLSLFVCVCVCVSPKHHFFALKINHNTFWPVN